MNKDKIFKFRRYVVAVSSFFAMISLVMLLIGFLLILIEFDCHLSSGGGKFYFFGGVVLFIFSYLVFDLAKLSGEEILMRKWEAEREEDSES